MNPDENKPTAWVLLDLDWRGEVEAVSLWASKALARRAMLESESDGGDIFEAPIYGEDISEDGNC